MPYDLLIKNGRIIDGSGRPAFHGDVGVAQGKTWSSDASADPRGGSSRLMGGWCRWGSWTTLSLRRAGPLGSALHLLVSPRRHQRH